MGSGIKFTKEGLRFCRETLLRAYYNPGQRDEIIKIAEVLGINLEELKDDALKIFLGIEKPAKAKMIVIAVCRQCHHLCRQLHHRQLYTGRDTYLHYCTKKCDGGTKSDYKQILDADTIPSWCPLSDTPEEL